MLKFSPRRWDHSHLVSPACSFRRSIKCVIQSGVLFILRKYRCAMAEKVALNMGLIIRKAWSKCLPTVVLNLSGILLLGELAEQILEVINWRGQ